MQIFLQDICACCYVQRSSSPVKCAAAYLHLRPTDIQALSGARGCCLSRSWAQLVHSERQDCTQLGTGILGAVVEH